LIGSLGSSRCGGEQVRRIAKGRIGVARRGLIDGVVVHGGATASMIIADREPAQQKCNAGMLHRT
jgi:hypothetical protein